MGLCDGDSIDNNQANGCNQDDLNGLITSFDVLFSDDSDSDSDSHSYSDSDDGYDRRRRRTRRRLSSRRKYSKNAWGTNQIRCMELELILLLNNDWYLRFV